jgi:alpha-glucosidase
VYDPFEKNVPSVGVGRDPQPTPMQWEPGPNAGFTTVTPWLPVADDFDPARPRRGGGQRHTGVATSEGLVVELT